MKTPEYVKNWASPEEIFKSLEEAVRRSDRYGGFINVSTMFAEDVLLPLFREMMEGDDD